MTPSYGYEDYRPQMGSPSETQVLGSSMVAPVTTGGHYVLRNVQSTKTQWDLEDPIFYHQWLLELTGLVRRQTDRLFLSTPRPAELVSGA